MMAIMMMTVMMMMMMMVMVNTSSNHTKGSTREDVGIVCLTRFKPVSTCVSTSATIISTASTVPVLSVPVQYLSVTMATTVSRNISSTLASIASTKYCQYQVPLMARLKPFSESVKGREGRSRRKDCFPLGECVRLQYCFK